MKPTAPPSLASLWLHWVIANASVVGAVFALVVIAAQWENDNPNASSIIILAFIPSALGLLFLVGYPQQVVLRRWVAYSDFWALIMPANMQLGAMFSVVFLVSLSFLGKGVEVVFGSRQFQFLDIVMFPIAALGFGAGFSLLQLPYLCLTRRGGWLWVIASALGTALAFHSQQFAWSVTLSRNELGSSLVGGSALMGTLAGAVYGAITGAALVVLMSGHARYPVRIAGYGPQQRP